MFHRCAAAVLQVLPCCYVPVDLKAGGCSSGQPVVCSGPVHVQPCYKGVYRMSCEAISSSIL
jgi:hypothetical protein